MRKCVLLKGYTRMPYFREPEHTHAAQVLLIEPTQEPVSPWPKQWKYCARISDEAGVRRQVAQLCAEAIIRAFSRAVVRPARAISTFSTVRLFGELPVQTIRFAMVPLPGWREVVHDGIHTHGVVRE
jgi:hypothetical protein